MKLTLKSAFTLVELLVVITIIAILSTGGTAVYTAQLQKARDTNRFTDIQAFRSGVEQYFTENASYPKATSAATGVTVYMGGKLPTDPSHNQTKCSNGTTAGQLCGYIYVTATKDGAAETVYEISAALENKTNITNKAAKDGLDDNARYEVSNDSAATLDSTANGGNPNSYLSGATSAATPNTSNCGRIGTTGTYHSCSKVGISQ